MQERKPLRIASPDKAVVPVDPSAERALAWLSRGEPPEETVCDDDAPKQTPDQLAQFRKASYRKVKPGRA
jgi:hypothetical protein